MPEFTTRARSPWFSKALPGTPDSPLVYVVPQAGLGAGAATPLVRALAPGLRAHSVRLPGRESRIGEPLPESLQQLAETVAEEITTHAAGAPVVLLGHCSGALVAFEAASLLVGVLRGLIVSAQVAPDCFDPVPLHELSPVQLRAYVAEHDLAAPAVTESAELWELVEPTLRADLQMTETYRVDETVLDVPVVAVSNPADARFGLAQVLPWGRRTRAEFRAVELDGEHDYFTTAPGVLAAVVRDALPLFGCTD
jgi:surfactin synthase thioesterase subunit